LLRGAAELWIVSDSVSRSDVVAVLGGGVDTRPFVAAELYKRKFVTKVVVSNVAEGRAAKIGAIPGHGKLNRMVLLKLGVPEADIEMFGKENGSSWDEAVALRDWADQHGVSRIIVPTEGFSTRRVRWIFNREFAGSSVQVEISAFEDPEDARPDWWETKEGLIAFQTEIMKYLYYRLKY
jgi:uncharacterized SAM-binding protein YcdF (DUF218 family)